MTPAAPGAAATQQRAAMRQRNRADLSDSEKAERRKQREAAGGAPGLRLPRTPAASSGNEPPPLHATRRKAWAELSDKEKGRTTQNARPLVALANLEPAGHRQHESCEPFIRRPVATSLLMLAVFIIGIIGYRRLPQSALRRWTIPPSRFPPLSGCEPRGDYLVDHRATRAAIRADAGPGADVVHQPGGASVVTLRFALDLRLDVAEQQVQAAINAAATLLPSDLPAPRSTTRSTQLMRQSSRWH